MRLQSDTGRGSESAKGKLTVEDDYPQRYVRQSTQIRRTQIRRTQKRKHILGVAVAKCFTRSGIVGRC